MAHRPTPDSDAEQHPVSEAGWGQSDAWGQTTRNPAPAIDPLSIAESVRYERGLELGRGGMGRVATAVDLRLGRQVAIKELRHGSDVTDAADRLVAEAQLTAGLDHPGIVAVHDAGRDSAGRPWYAMRLVRGETLTRLAAAAPDPAARLRLVPRLLAACHAVAHAHERGIVHRDLKPDNLLAGPHGETQVADWGLAATVDTAQRGGAVGTRGFMAPEVAAGRPATPQSDVYSLGACLLSVLCGAKPPGDLPRQLLDLPTELRAIASRCLQTDPAQRYPTAAELAEDLTAWLDGRRVAAHHYSTGQLAWRLLQAWRWPLAVAATGMAIVVAVAWQGWQSTVVQRDRAQAAESEAIAAQAQAQMAHKEAQESLGQAYVAASARADSAGARPEAEVLATAALAIAPSAAATGLLAKVQPGPAVSLLAEMALPECLSYRLSPGGDWMLCHRTNEVVVYNSKTGQPMRGFAGQYIGGAIDPLGEVVVLTSNDYQARWFGIRADVPQTTQTYVPGNSTLELDPSGRWLVSYNAQHVQFFDAVGAPGVSGTVCSHNQPAAAMALDRDQPRAVVACLPGNLRTQVAQGADWNLVSPVDAGVAVTATALTLTDDDEPILGSQQGGVWWRGIDLVARDVFLPSAARVQSLAARHDQLVAVLEGAGPLVWRPLSQPPVRLPHSHAIAAEIADDGTVVVLGRTLRRWSVSPATQVARVAGTAGLATVAVAQGTGALATGGGEGIVTLWRANPPTAYTQRIGLHTIKALAFSATGDKLWVGTLGTPGLYVVDVASGKSKPVAGGPEVRRLGVLPDNRLWLLTYANQLVVLDEQGHQQILGPVGPLALSGSDAAARLDGAEVVVADVHGRVFVVATAPPYTSAATIALPQVGKVALSSDGKQVAASQGANLLWLQRDGTVLWKHTTDDQRIEDVALAPDNALLYGAGRDGVIRVLETTTGKEVARFSGHTQRVGAVTLTASGDLLSVGWDGVLQRWQTAVLNQRIGVDANLTRQRWGVTVQDALTLPVH